MCPTAARQSPTRSFYQPHSCRNNTNAPSQNEKHTHGTWNSGLGLGPGSGSASPTHYRCEPTILFLAIQSLADEARATIASAGTTCRHLFGLVVGRRTAAQIASLPNFCARL